MYMTSPRTPLIGAICATLLIFSVWFLDVPSGEIIYEYGVRPLAAAGEDNLGSINGTNGQAEGISESPIINVPFQPTDRPLILYAYSESETARINLQYFISHGLHAAADFIFILNGETDVSSLIPQADNIKYVQRPNDCYDLGAYAEILTKNNLYKRYQKFIMLNASIRGPFLPSWAQSCWSDLYLSKLSPSIKLVGMTANCWPTFHVQSMIWATDSIGLEVLLFPSSSALAKFPSFPIWQLSDKPAPPESHNPGINSCFHSWNAAVNAEIGATALMKAAGYEVEAMMSAFHGVDKMVGENGLGDHHRHHPNGAGKSFVNIDVNGSEYERHCDLTQNGDVLRDGKYFGTNVHPFETVFMKSNRDVDPVTLDRLTSWMEGSGFSSYKYCKA